MSPLSFSVLVSLTLSGWILHSMYTLYETYNIPTCNEKSHTCLRPYWKSTDVFQLFICTSLSNHPMNPLKTIYYNSSFTFDKPLKLDFRVKLPDKVINNGSMFLHVFLTKSKVYQKQITSELITSKLTSFAVSSLTKYLHKRPQTFKLLGREEAQTVTESIKPISHWKPNIVINFVSNPQTIPTDALTPEIASLLKINAKLQYLPIVYISEGRYRVRDLLPIEKSYNELPLNIDTETSTLGKLRFMIFVESSLSTMHKLGFTEYDTDDVKGILFDTSLYLLLLTVFFSSFHLLFDFLAFKNDIQFWRKQNSMEGLSLSSLVWRCVSQIIIALYLHDKQTSLIVLIPAAIGAVIEVWKVKKALKIEIHGFSFTMKSRSSAEMATDDYDFTFMKYLSIYVLYPLVLVGAIYSLIYNEHHSWYSWLIESAANGVYVFGFLFMLPQLFINYKLKSVAHLPWKAFMYKAFNTFIDDIFAILLTSIPTSHRLAAFRGDIVFLIYLYQRWLYPVDKSRPDEYGEILEEEDNKKKN